MTRNEAARFLGMSPGTLANWASQGTGPPHMPNKNGRTFYHRVDLIAWRDGGVCRACGHKIPMRDRRSCTDGE